MHFFYADESGSTGTDLSNAEQPIFVLGGISVRDKGWNATQKSVASAIQKYFAPGLVPDDFELHAHELLSPSGDGPFEGHDRERRHGLVEALLHVLEDRRHDNVLVALDKPNLESQAKVDLSTRIHLVPNDPYPLAFDQYVSAVEKHVRDRLGSSARAMVIVDEHDTYEPVVDAVIRHRRHSIAKTYRLKWIVEFAHPVDSIRNPMIQLTDLVVYIARRFFEVDGGYRPDWSREARNQYRSWYRRIHERRKNKSVVPYEDRHRDVINGLMGAVYCTPSRGAFSPE